MNTTNPNDGSSSASGSSSPGPARSRRRPLFLTLGALALAASTALAATAFAKPGGPGCGGRDGMHGALRGGKGGPSLEGLERRIAGLGLAAEQEKAAYTIVDQARSDERARRGEMRTAHQRMRELLSQDAPDPRAVEAQADALGALQTESQKARLRTLLALRPLLTAEQWQALQPPRASAMGGPPRGAPDASDDAGDPS